MLATQSMTKKLQSVAGYIFSCMRVLYLTVCVCACCRRCVKIGQLLLSVAATAKTFSHTSSAYEVATEDTVRLRQICHNAHLLQHFERELTGCWQRVGMQTIKFNYKTYKYAYVYIYIYTRYMTIPHMCLQYMYVCQWLVTGISSANS